MNYFEIARDLVSVDDLHQVCSILKTHLTGEDRDQVLLLENQLANWEKRFRHDAPWSINERNRITFALLGIISEAEKNTNPSILKERQREIERLLERTYEKVSSLEKPANMTDEVLNKLEKVSPNNFEQLKNLSIEFQKPKSDKGDTLELIDYWEEQVQNSGAVSNQDAKLLSQLLASSPSTLSALLNERRHRNASIKLLEKRIDTYKSKYEKIKTAGIAALAGAWLGSLFLNNHSESVFGHGYDDNGYDEKGYDFEGFNRDGCDAHGHHHIEGPISLDHHHPDSDHGDLHEHHH